ncbi:hypothetical protein [Thermococcus sp.]
MDFVLGLGVLLYSLNIAGFLWVTYDVLKNQKLMPESEKFVWIFLAVLFGSLVALVYALVIKVSGKYEEVELEEEFRVW